MSDEPYDESVPVGERLGSQRLLDADLRSVEAMTAPPPIRNRLTVAGKRPRGKRAKREKAPLSAVQQKPAESAGKRRASRVGLASSAMEVVGLASVSAGFWMIHVWLGLIVAGLSLVLLGVATGR